MERAHYKEHEIKEALLKRDWPSYNPADYEGYFMYIQHDDVVDEEGNPTAEAVFVIDKICKQ